MKILSVFFKCLIFLLLSANIFAGVSLKNGNFYISYTDIVAPGGGHNLKIVRTYNSKATRVGWFGFGWGSDYETFLRVNPDGSVIVHENGTGARTRFTPKKAVNADAATDKIIAAVKKKSNVSEKTIKELRVKLRNDAESRQAYSLKYSIVTTLPKGSVLYSSKRGIQRLKVVANGFERIYNDGKVETFNKDGRLKKIKDKYGYTIDFNFKNDQLHSIVDSEAKQIFFDWYANKRAKAIWTTSKNSKTEYFYENLNLINVKDVEKNNYKHSYDYNHNMTEIAYKDGTKLSVGYNKTQFVSKVTERNGEITGYKYGENKANPQFHYWTIVSKKLPNGNKSENRYEYEIKTKPDGSTYTYRIATNIRNLKTETIYSECCSLPIKITRGNHITSFEYNDGLLIKKSSTKGDMVELSYHKKFKKITKVVDNKGWTKFTYDKKGNLSKAVNNAGKSVLLVYDRKGRITKMVDYNKGSKKRRTLSFVYNALGKPVEIKMSKVGKINVVYDDYGEIKKVDSKAGHKMALQVTEAFQSLLAIVKPAGVNLRM